MWDIFRSEALEKLQELEESLLKIESDGSNSSDIDAMYRAIHTFKGNARIMGLLNLESLAHQAEDLMGLVRDQDLPFTPSIAQVLFKVLDSFRTLIQEVSTQKQDIELSQVTELFNELVHLVSTSQAELGMSVQTPAPIQPHEEDQEEEIDLSQDDMYKSIYLEMVQQDRKTIERCLHELLDGDDSSHVLAENILLSWYHATENIGLHDALHLMEQATQHFNAKNYHEVLKHLNAFYNHIFDDFPESPSDSSPKALNPEQLFFQILENEIILFSEGLHQLLNDQESDQDLLQEALNAITDLAEKHNYVRLLNICHSLKQLLLAPLNQELLKKAEYLFFKELVAIKESAVEIGQNIEDNTIQYTFQQWHANRIFSHLSQLKDLAQQLLYETKLTTEVQILITDILQLLNYIHHTCLYYQLKTAAELSTVFQDIYIRISRNELPLNPALPEETMLFISGLGREIDNPDNLEDDFFEQLMERVQSLNYESNSLSTLNYWINHLRLEPAFKEVLTSENLLTIETCYKKNMFFYLIQINLETSPQFTEQVYQWLQDDLLSVISNITIYKDQHTEFKFLISSMLTTQEMKAAIANFDPQNTIQFEAISPQESFEQTVNQPPLPIQNSKNKLNQSATTTPSKNIEEENKMQVKTINPINNNFLKVDLQKVNRLMDLAGEIGLAAGGLLSHPELQDLNLTGFQIVAQNLMTLIRELQGETSSLRLVPVSVLFKRMQRLIRDLKQTTQKEIELVVTGETTEIDKMMVDKLFDPLVHMIRNAVDHGIEMPEERIKQGKPQSGKLLLNATHQAGEVIISLIDDGRGLNREAILNKAIENGLIETDHELEEQAIFELIFEPGFSTAKQLSTLSGRGVGMDVVKHTMTELRGRYRIKSEANKGTQISLHLPLTLAFIEGMVIEVNQTLYAIPIEAISEVFKVKQSQVTTIASEKAEVIKVRDELIPTCWLHKFYGIQQEENKITDDKVVVVTQSSHGNLAIPVDRLIGNQQVTLKPLTGILKDIRAGAGYGLLSSGNVAIVLDCERLHAS